jgi:hypothetical protein
MANGGMGSEENLTRYHTSTRTGAADSCVLELVALRHGFQRLVPCPLAVCFRVGLHASQKIKN